MVQRGFGSTTRVDMKRGRDSSAGRDIGGHAAIDSIFSPSPDTLTQRVNPAGSSRSADELVQQLREFQAAFPAFVRSDGRPDLVEVRRTNVYHELLALGEQAGPSHLTRVSTPTREPAPV